MSLSSLPATAPVEMMVPQAAQLWMNILNWGLVVVVVLLVLNDWRRQGSSVGVWLVLGGALTTLNEPIVDVLGKCWFPAIGSMVLLKAWGVSVPTYMVPVYAWYVGGQAFLAYRLYRKGLSRRGVFGLYAAFAAVNVLLEMPGLNLPQPLYSYYGDQPLVVLRFPLWWTFCNALMPMMIAGVAYIGEPLLQGARRLLLVPLVWMTAAATNALVAAPIWVALNAEGTNLAWTHLAAAVSFGMGLMVCYGLSQAVASDAEPWTGRHRPVPAPSRG
ncbi:MAG: hypothetical protein QJR02_00185 [Sinobacteraceae bacterium]|nr:hypothetical protein [Nevskiaceae bacterium]